MLVASDDEHNGEGGDGGTETTRARARAKWKWKMAAGAKPNTGEPKHAEPSKIKSNVSSRYTFFFTYTLFSKFRFYITFHT